MIVIIGAGISGISAGYHFKKRGERTAVFEKTDSWGGLCDNFTVDGFRFDKFVHLSFSDIEYVKNIFSNSAPYNCHPPKSYNYYQGKWIKHPAQNNIFNLSATEKYKIIKGFMLKNRKESYKNQNYECWLRSQYGDYFAEKFPMVYTEKYWGARPRELSVGWAIKRMHSSSLVEVLKGAFREEKKETYYANEMRYPKEGGYKAFLETMAAECDIRLNKEVTLILPDIKKIKFSDGDEISYDYLVSSMPLPELVKVIKGVPERVKYAAQALHFTSGSIVSIGFSRPDIAKNLWFYIYDKDIYAARCNSPSIKSSNNAPKGCSSLQFEIFFPKKTSAKETEESLGEHVIGRGEHMGLFNRSDIIVMDCRHIQYANVCFTKDMERYRSDIHKYLREIGIRCIGRFGEWDYLWSDQCVLSGKKMADEICKEKIQGKTNGI